MAEYHSINKAAEVLYISQPNLSRAIRELEQETGVTIFQRTPQGVTVTFAGEELLSHARIILEELEQIRRMAEGEATLQRFSLCVPRAGYISNAFTRFLSQLDSERKMLVDYKETSAIGALQNVLDGGFHLGILRYQKAMEPYFQALLREQGLNVRQVCQFSYLAAMSRDNPLSRKRPLLFEDLKHLTEITHGDSYILSAARQVPDQETQVGTDRKIHVYDSMGQLAMLRRGQRNQSGHCGALRPAKWCGSCGPAPSPAAVLRRAEILFQQLRISTALPSGSCRRKYALPCWSNRIGSKKVTHGCSRRAS